MTHQCQTCQYLGAAEVVERFEVMDSMYGRAPSRVLVEIDTCARCGSTDLKAVHLCECCEAAPVEVKGTDLCSACYAAAEAEQDARVVRINTNLNKMRAA